MDQEVISIKWTREDIKRLLAENKQPCTDKAIDDFLQRLDLKYFEEQCIQDGWERLSSNIKGKL